MLDVKSTQEANQQLWAKFPELQGRKLTGGTGDAAYRDEWWSLYNNAKRGSASKVPAPSARPVGAVTQPCPIAALCADIDNLSQMPLMARLGAEQTLMERLKMVDPKKSRGT